MVLKGGASSCGRVAPVPHLTPHAPPRPVQQKRLHFIFVWREKDMASAPHSGTLHLLLSFFFFLHKILEGVDRLEATEIIRDQQHASLSRSLCVLKKSRCTGIRSRYRGTSLVKNTTHPGPHSRTIPRVLWWFQGGELFLMSKALSYCASFSKVHASGSAVCS